MTKKSTKGIFYLKTKFRIRSWLGSVHPEVKLFLRQPSQSKHVVRVWEIKWCVCHVDPGMKIDLIKRMHSSLLVDWPRRGGVVLHGTPLQRTPFYGPAPPSCPPFLVNRMTGRRFWKYYLVQNFVCGWWRSNRVCRTACVLEKRSWKIFKVGRQPVERTVLSPSVLKFHIDNQWKPPSLTGVRLVMSRRIGWWTDPVIPIWREQVDFTGFI